MVAVRQDEFERLCKAGLINFGAEKNYAIVNKKKKAKRKNWTHDITGGKNTLLFF